MIRFGSRGSDLALTQTRAVAAAIQAATGVEYSIEVIETRGDKNLSQPLPSIGGKGLFTAELEAALRNHVIDVAVHSLKDLPVEDPEGLTVGAIPARECPADVLVFDPRARDPEGGTIPLLADSVVGTSSPRRSSSLWSLRSDLEMRDIRGNVETRANKVRKGDYHATMLAAAGLARLGLETPGLERHELPTDVCTPAPGQGALGVQCRADDARVLELLASIHDATTATCVTAERKVLLDLGGGCSMPLGVLVEPSGSGFRLIANLFSESRPRCGMRLEFFGSDPIELAKRAVAAYGPLLAEPLAMARIALLRPGGSDGQLRRALGLAGADVEPVAVSDIQPIPIEDPALRCEGVRHVAFTSSRAVDWFFEHAAGRGLEPGTFEYFAVGPATADAVRRRGHECRAPEDAPGGEALAKRMLQLGLTGPVLYPCAEDRHESFEQAAQAGGLEVRPLPVYRTHVIEGIVLPESQFVVLTSPSAVQAFAARSEESAEPGRLLAIGETTAAAMRELGLEPAATAQYPTAHALIDCIRGLRP